MSLGIPVYPSSYLSYNVLSPCCEEKEHQPCPASFLATSAHAEPVPEQRIPQGQYGYIPVYPSPGHSLESPKSHRLPGLSDRWHPCPSPSNAHGLLDVYVASASRSGDSFQGPPRRRQIRSACACIKQPWSGWFRSPPGCPFGIVQTSTPPVAGSHCQNGQGSIINFESRCPVPLSLRRSAPNSSACLASPALDLPGHIHVSPILGS